MDSTSQKRDSLRKRIQQFSIDVTIGIAVRLFGSLPLTAYRPLAVFFSRLIRLFHPASMRLICSNLQIAFPNMSKAERVELAKSNIVHTLLIGFELAYFIRHPERIRTCFELVEDTRSPEDKKTPHIICLPHLGNWEVFGQTASLIGYRGAAVARPLFSKKLNDLINQARSINGLKIIERKGAVRAVIGALKDNYTIGMLVDQNLSLSHGGMFTLFFGLPATCTKMPAFLARRRNYNIVLCDCVRIAPGHFRIETQALPKPVSDYPDDESLTNDIIRQIEEMIRRHPEQYIWHYRRWRYIPNNASDSLKARYPYYADSLKYACPEPLLEQAEALQRST